MSSRLRPGVRDLGPGRTSVTGVGRLSFTVGVPTGSFRDNLDDVGFGGSLFGGVRFGDTPFVLGLDLGVLVYGRTVDTVPFSRTVGPRVTIFCQGWNEFHPEVRR